MFDQVKAEQIVERVWQGKSLRTAASEVGVKHPTFLAWADENPVIGDQYARAIAERAEVHAERLEAIVDKVESGELAPDQGRVMADTLKWIACKLKPRKYGDRVQVDADMRLQVIIEDPTRNVRAALIAKPAIDHDDK